MAHIGQTHNLLEFTQPVSSFAEGMIDSESASTDEYLHLQPVIESLPPELSEEERTEAVYFI